MINLRDPCVDHHLSVLGDGHRTFQDLSHKLGDQVLAPSPGRGIGAEPPLFDNLIKQPLLQNLLAGGACLRRCLGISHWNLPPSSYRVHPSASPAFPCCPRHRAATLPASRCPAKCPGGRTSGFAGPTAPSMASPAWPPSPAQSLPGS